MAPGDYPKLCPNSGRVLPARQRGVTARSAALDVVCEACGRSVAARPDPASGRALLYAMHPRAGVSLPAATRRRTA
jgi:hypothetical protein